MWAEQAYTEKGAGKKQIQEVESHMRIKLQNKTGNI